MPSSALHFLTIAELAAGYRNRQFSPVEVTQAYLDRIAALDSRLGGYITVTGDEAIAAARDAERAFLSGRDNGPLSGVPLGLKDIIDTRLMPTTYGASFRRGQPARQDATVVRKLEDAGAIFLGKHNLLEFAMGGTDTNPHYGPSRNPWNTERFSGGSSSGSAVAVAAGMCAGAIGTDTGGSIRQPSSYCGISGLKPTPGLVSLAGVFPLSPSLDTVGPMARTVEDIALLLQAIVGYDQLDPLSVPSGNASYALDIQSASLHGVRLGVPRRWMTEQAHSEVLRSVEEAISVMVDEGAEVREVGVPFVDQAQEVYRAICFPEAAESHELYYRVFRDQYGPNVRQRIEEGMSISRDARMAAIARQRQLADAVHALFSQVDVLILPTQPSVAPRLSRLAAPGDPAAALDAPSEEQRVAELNNRWRFNVPFNLAYVPALSIPVRPSADGLPIGMQIVARPMDEGTALRIGHAYQRVTAWHQAEPPC